MSIVLIQLSHGQLAKLYGRLERGETFTISWATGWVNPRRRPRLALLVGLADTAQKIDGPAESDVLSVVALATLRGSGLQSFPNGRLKLATPVLLEASVAIETIAGNLEISDQADRLPSARELDYLEASDLVDELVDHCPELAPIVENWRENEALDH